MLSGALIAHSIQVTWPVCRALGCCTSDRRRDVRVCTDRRHSSMHARLSTLSGVKKLRLTLEDELGCTAFEEHLQREFAMESLKFWQAVRHWQETALLEGGGSGSSVTATARTLFDTFLAEGAPLQVNVGSGIRNEAGRRIMKSEKKGAVNVDADLFADALEEIELLMHRDNFKRFVESSSWDSLTDSWKLAGKLETAIAGVSAPLKHTSLVSQ